MPSSRPHEVLVEPGKESLRFLQVWCAEKIETGLWTSSTVRRMTFFRFAREEDAMLFRVVVPGRWLK